jgi:hypothetical protein
MDNRIIRVTGKGLLKLKPDMTRLTLSIEGTYPDYSKALKRSCDDTDSLKEAIQTLGFAASDLKTLNFNIDSAYESYRDKHNDYQRRFVGYKYSHTLKLEFLSDNDLLGRALYTLAHSSVKPEFHISYSVKDPEKAKNELLSNAVADAKAKSSVLAAAAGVSLNEILSIDYSWGEINFDVRPMNRPIMAEECLEASVCDAGYQMDIEPDDITLSDTVTIVWSIK